MKRPRPRWIPVCLISLLAICTGCSMTQKAAMDKVQTPALREADSPAQGRMLIWYAELSLAVDEVPAAAARITDVAKASGGYVESKTDTGERGK